MFKNLGEHFTNSLGGLVVRLYNIYGNEKVSHKSHVIPDLINQAKMHKSIKLLTNGLEQRQFLFVEDCCEGLYVISQNYNELLKYNSAIDLTSFEWMSLRKIVKIVSGIYDCNFEYSEHSADFVLKLTPNNLVLNYWKPRTSIYEGILKIVGEI